MVAVWREGEDGPYFFHFAKNEAEAWKLAEKMADEENMLIRDLLNLPPLPSAPSSPSPRAGRGGTP